MPKLGETVTEGTIGTWLKQVGDDVAFDDPLFEVSTDKVDSEIPSPYDGVLLEILVDAGETVPVGTVLARIGEPGAAPAGAAGTAAAAPAGAAPRAPRAPAAAAAPAAGGAAAGCCRRWCAGSPPSTGSTSPRSPGTGAGGRIRREDVEKAIAGGPARAAAAPPRPLPRRRGGARAAAPRPRRGRHGRRPTARDEVVTLSRMRLAVAAGMKASQTAAASVWTSVEVDFDNVERVRAEAQGPVQEGDRRVAVLPAVRLPGGGRRAAGVPDRQLLDRRRGQDHDAAPLRQPRHRGRPGPAGPRRAGRQGRRRAEHPRDRQRDRHQGGGGAGKKLAMADMQGSTFTITNPGPVRQLRLVADHQPAQRRRSCAPTA